MSFFFSVFLHCRSRTDLSLCAALILHSHLHNQQSPASPQSCCSQWDICGARKHWGAAGSYPHCVGQDDRRKAVLSSAAAWFSLDIFIAFNNFLCLCYDKSPCQGPHGLPGITACCSHVTSMCHYIHEVVGIHFVCSGLFVLQDRPSHCEVSGFHLPNTHTWEHSALAQCLGPAAHTGIADLVCTYRVFI